MISKTKVKLKTLILICVEQQFRQTVVQFDFTYVKGHRTETEIRLKYFSLKWEISAILKRVKQCTLKIQIVTIFTINIFL